MGGAYRFKMTPEIERSQEPRWSSVATSALGGLLGGLAGGVFVAGVTSVVKAMMDFVAIQVTWVLIVVPLIGLSFGVLVLQRYGQRESARTLRSAGVQADITGDVIAFAGEEERFPWRQAGVRTVAIFSTVGLGAAMGTEAPAAYLGAAAGACLGDRGTWWRRLVRPAAVGGGAAGVAVLMAIPLVGTAYLLEIGRRHDAPLSAERVAPALIGGLVGWAINVVFHLDLIRLVVPKESPSTVLQAAVTAVFIGAISGGITALAASAIYRAKRWQASAGIRLAIGASALGVTALTLALIASPSAAVGPGGGAISWAETTNALPSALLAVALLRAAATTAAVAAGGCGGVFVPFLAIGDLAGRVFAPALGLGNDLAGAAGAAGGIAGGYRLPFTAIAMVLGVGGPRLATLTCLATVAIAYLAGAGVTAVLGRLVGRRRRDESSFRPASA